ncbi:MAG TPA: hypothetical protein VL978_01715 [Puia sp.]|nr:hypothetical protein [Puia sp.]
MPDPTKENSEKARALRKLINKWRTSLETRSKAELLLSKKPGLKKSPPGSPSKKS